MTRDRRQQEPIAIVGMGCRFPGGANEPSKLWQLLESPHDVSKEIPNDRFHLGRFYHKDGPHHGTTNVRSAYFLEDDVTQFDTKFFAIPPGEAEIMDPQHRLLMEVVYEAIDRAGLCMHSLSGSNTGVYVGIMCQDYFALQAQDLNSVPTYAATGIAASNASSRISYFFNWHGPSMTLDTACSSSMVGVHEAVQALRNGTSSMAVACGANLMLSGFPFVTESKLGMLSPSGKSHMWDSRADGYARGEGIACVVMKTLSQALEDGDTIECIIRETGVNHDGKTKGLTMPSAVAQAALIRDTYARAGLDPTSRAGRCQFFEAHGTGTPAGDPQEAEALSRAFFPGYSGVSGGGIQQHDEDEDDQLLVGSIKTVVGHTEGTAGLAGLIKACLALQNATVPPNLLFEQLNPALEPFTRHLRVPTSSQPWPDLPPGTPRRASVNSFGFGGTNAHAILEEYKPKSQESGQEASLVPSACHAPIVLSAASKKSLLSVAQSMKQFLDTQEQVDLGLLAWNLGTKRSALAHRLSLYASSVEELQEKLESIVKTAAQDKSSSKLGVQSLSAPPSILGVFTGQGAQWPTMGARLIEHGGLARGILSSLDASLQNLPVSHRPSWSLSDHLLADKSNSRLHEAAVAQPLATAVQLMLIGLLRASGIRFSAVVGHSSGEIAAAHAAGFLSAGDAIRVAYYRGMYAGLAGGSENQKGGMLAAGTSIEDATELCMIDEFSNTLSVAAHNSPTSVTLSGDEAAVGLAIDILEEEGKFARALRVDTAYHSSHMMRCSAPYLAALRRCRIQPLRPEPEDHAPLWFSSVHTDARVMMAGESSGIDGQYWIDNMTKPVLFYSAIKAAATHSIGINGAVEVGPHPALQGPAKETIKAVTGREVPYTGTLRRGTNDIEAFADAMGYIWCHFGPSAVDLGSLQQAGNSESALSLQAIPNLPSYPWEHERSLWAESRSSKLFRTMPGQYHDLLGILTADGTAEEWRWRNILKVNEIGWLSGHALQGQTVFPGTGYIALAMEAGLQLANGLGKGGVAKSIDLLDLEISKAIALSDAFGTELLVCMTKVEHVDRPGAASITANYAVFSSTGKGASNLVQNCTGHILIELGDQDAQTEELHFAERVPPVAEFAAVDVDRFYQVLKDDLGYGYEGPFRSLVKIQRRFGSSMATIQNTGFQDDETPLLFHPAMLDSALQGANAAASAPGDGRLWSIVAPTYFRRVTLIPALCGRAMTDTVEIDCTITSPHLDDRITADIAVYSADYEKQVMELEGVRFSPFATATASDDRHFFQETFLCLDEPDASVAIGDWSPTPEQHKKGLDAERAAFFYLKTLCLSVSDSDRASLPWYRQSFISTAESLYNQVKAGRHPHAPADWINDTKEEMEAIMSTYGAQDADFKLTRAVGEHLLLPEVLKGDSSILEYMTKENTLDRYYLEAVGYSTLNTFMAGIMDQLAHRYPRMRLLEIGAGTGGTTQAILGALGSAFSSYTYTDISSGFFDKAASKFASHRHKMTFKMLDVEKDPSKQGFADKSYDVVVAANVLHATRSMKETLQHCRRLMRPGGYLVLLEIIRSDVMRHGLVMGGLSGWWAGLDDGRTTGPCLTLTEWEKVLRSSGFSGIETTTPMSDPVAVPGAVFVARAVDETVSMLRTPLMSTLNDASHGPLLIVGGETSVTRDMSMQLARLLDMYFAPIICIPHFDELPDELPKDLHVINLGEADGNLFKSIGEERWESFKRLIASTASMLWVLREGQSVNPYGSISIGLFRTIFYELPGTLLQTLDLGRDVPPSAVQASTIAELILRLRSFTQMARRGESDKVLWSFEPELVLEADGRFYIPRIRQNISQNTRYNSSKRSIKRLAPVDKGILELVKNAHVSSYSLREKHMTPVAKSMVLNDFEEVDSQESEVSEAEDVEHSETITIRITCSLLSSLKTPAGYYFLQLGEDLATGHKTLCFSDSNTSVVTVPRSFALRVDDGQTQQEIVDGQFMSFVVAEIMVQQMLAILPPAGTTMAYEPDPVISSLLSRQLASMGRKAVFITSKPGIKTRNWVRLHARSPKRHIDAVVDPDVSLYVDASDGSLEPEDRDAQVMDLLGRRICSSLPELCARTSLATLAASTASVLPERAPTSITRLLRKGAAFASSQLNSIPDGAPLDILPLKQVTGSLPPRSRFSLVYWQVDKQLPVSVEPVLKRGDLFRPDRTYWLAGLGGDFGRSLADFMISRNARHLVITSRNPLVDQGWVDWHKERGAAIEYRACDLVDFQSTKQVRDDIFRTMPPVAGVVNGAMVLRDASVVQMTFESFNAVLQTKVQSTVNLDQLFASKRLDWFIGLSSIGAMTGNPGQAPYSAGNCFMKTLIRQRRARGMAGSTIDICRVAGIGYIERESTGRLTREHQERLKTRSGTLSMSELDLHQSFAEAIVCGRPDSGLSPEVITGLSPITVEEARLAFWSPNPRFGLLIQEEELAGADAAGGSKANTVPARQLLQAAESQEEMAGILLAVVKTKLQALMFLSDTDGLPDTTPLVDLGVDSLVGVEMRAWFLKELGVEVPVMKILGGVSISGLVEDVLKKYVEKRVDSK